MATTVQSVPGIQAQRWSVPRWVLHWRRAVALHPESYVSGCYGRAVRVLVGSADHGGIID